MSELNQGHVSKEAERAAAQYQLLLEVTNSVASHLDLRELFKAIAACLKSVVNCDGAAMLLHDPESGLLRVHALDPPRMLGDLPVGEGVLTPIEGTPGARAFNTRRAVIMTSAELENSESPLVQQVAAAGIRSGCAVPLVIHGRALGTLDVVSRQEDAFTEEDAELLLQVASQIAIAVQNALNFEAALAAEKQMAHDRDRLQLLLEVNNAIVKYLDLRELIRAVCARLRDLLHHDFAGTMLYDDDAGVLRPYAYTSDLPDRLRFIEEGMPVPLEGTAPGLAFTSGRAVVVAKANPEEFTAETAKQAMAQGVKSGCVVPLIARGRKLGVIGVGSFQEGAFAEEDAELLSQVAAQVAIAVENALAYREIEGLKNRLSAEKLYLEEEINTAYNFEQIIGSSPALMRILKQVEIVAPTDSTVLIQGETGTGKEVIARAIHSLSNRRERTLVKLNCAAIPTGLLESELFGHEKGAFTGAIAQRVGRFELANRGSLFLDEVGEIPQELQPKLLRVLQEREFERLGSTRTIRVDARLIAATNRDLAQMVAEKKFRDDLYYRLNVFPITIPPLRERREDIPLLVRFFASKCARLMKKRIEAIPADAVAALQEYTWPGNIRELENLIERAVILTPGSELQVPFSELKLPDKPAALMTAHAASGRALPASESPNDASSLEAVERDHIVRVLRETNWIVSGPNGAAARLGLKRTTLQARMKKLGVSRDPSDS